MKLNTKILADIFQSNMILPLNKDFKLGGVVDPQEKVTIRFNQDHYPETETLVTYQALKELNNGLRGGVTYIRSCGVSFDVDVKLKRMRDSYPFEGPGIKPAGMPISILGGHGDQPLEDNKNASHLVNSPDDVRKAVREQFKKGAENIKLMATGGIISQGDEIDDTELL